MSTLVQIIYISRSTNPSANPANGVDPVVSRILAHSRTNNRRNGLVGVLYFGDGCFFQCLEGEAVAVNTLYAKLEQDDRHTDLKIISRKEIAAPMFKDWSMKYVATEKEMAALLRRAGLNLFDPYQFSASVTQEVIDLLQQSAEPAAPQVASPASPPAPAPASPAAPAPARSRAVPEPVQPAAAKPSAVSRFGLATVVGIAVATALWFALGT